MNPNATAPSPISSSPAATPAAGHPRRPAQPSQHPFAVQLHCPCLHVTADEFLDQQRDAISARQHIGDQRRRRIRPQRRAHQLAHCPLRQRPDRQYRRQTLPPQRPDNSVSIRRLPGARRPQDNEATDGVLAYRLRFTFLHYVPRLSGVPPGPGLMHRWAMT